MERAKAGLNPNVILHIGITTSTTLQRDLTLNLSQLFLKDPATVAICLNKR